MYDIIIVGSGIVGGTTAIALAKQSSLKIAIVDANPFAAVTWQKNDAWDDRVSAISPSSKRILENLDIWKTIQSKRISPYTEMHVWDAIGDGNIHFDCYAFGEPCLGYIIEDRVIRSSLIEHYKNYPTLSFLAPFKPSSLLRKEECIELISEDQTVLQGKLLIAADGANSWVRKTIAIKLASKAYHHTAIVSNVKTEFPHQSTAWQRFLAKGPLAFLPLHDSHHSSIVWSTSPDDAARLMACDDTTFKVHLAHAFQKKLGDILSVSARQHFPLYRRHANQYVQDRLALVGDAAHTVHPLAGQGVNMGLLDAATLTDVILKAHEKNRSFSSETTLRRYERARKSDTCRMLLMIDALKHLFEHKEKSVQSIRNIGLTFANHTPLLKSFFANYAMGKRDDLPRLAKKRGGQKVI